MKRFLTLALVGAVALGASSVAYANTCAFDNVPAATLLFPFVAFNYDDSPQGTTTIFSVTNTSYQAQIVHVTVWTDFSVAILDFNILLTGYDVLRYNIRDILDLGFLPVTLNEAHDDAEGAQEDGPVSELNQYRPGDPADLPQPLATNTLGSRCATSNQAYPGLYANAIPSNILALFQGWLQSSQTVPRFHENCTAADDDEYVPIPMPWFEARDTTDDTWMYITMDVVWNCNLQFPDELGYFNNEIRYDNVLIGDTAWVSNLARASEVDKAIGLEADFAINSTINSRGFPTTFYSKFANDPLLDFTSDYREPLPTAWAFRYQDSEVLGLETYIRAWKGGTFYPIVPDLFLEDPDESPLEMWALNCLAYTYYTWDEDENVSVTPTNPWSMPGGERVVINLLPLETQEVRVTQFNVIDAYGWMLFIWPASNWTFGTPLLPDADQYQTWMGVKYVKTGDYSGAMTGAVMANYNCFSNQVLPDLGWNDSND